MLIGFKFQNFRSFLTEQTFSFSTSSDRTHESTHLMRTGMKAVPRVSKAAIAFGPNASGKTNLVVALATFRDLILHSTAYSDAQFRERHTPFRFGPSMSQPTVFEIDVLLDHVRYRYAISYDSQRIRSERLLVYRTGKSQRWFDRHFDEAAQKEEWAPFSPNFNGPREMWRKATRPKALFLTTAAQLNSEQLAPLLRWVEHRLEIVLPADMSDISRVATQIQDVDFKARVLGLLHTVDIHVDDVRVAEHELSQVRSIAPRGAAAGYFKHGARTSIEFLYTREGGLPIWLDSVFEAAGTQRLIGLFGPLLQAIEHGKFLLIDEFDTSLHPLVARYLIQLINDPSVSNRGAQLFLTSHNTTLMDLEILRRDEIWLVEVNERHASNLSPLLRSSPRKHELIAKNYLRGRYGAVPLIRSEPREASDAVRAR
jgi:AAA15 family ATPase/GTPase